jgi:hypothetical protein
MKLEPWQEELVKEFTRSLRPKFLNIFFPRMAGKATLFKQLEQFRKEPNMKPITEMTTAEMVAEYNQLTAKTIKKFSSRAAGEKQLQTARGAIAPPPAAKPPAASPTTAPTTGKNPKRAEGQRETWNDRKVAAARTKKDRVTANGEEFKSVAAAFIKFNLPMNKHISFRKTLKELGVHSFIAPTGEKFNFKVVAAAKA